MAASDTSVRIVIQLLELPLFGSEKLPKYEAPGASSSSSPGWAALMAACYLPLVLWGPLLGAVTWAYYRRRVSAPVVVV
jgi:hypothetical protein